MLELNVKTYGDAASQPVVLMHGLFGASTNWGSVARQLADRFRVLVPDLRNHGDSPHATDSSYVAMVDDVVALLDRFDLPSATLIGHSMGGKVAMQLALTRPQRVARLVVVDMAPVRYTHDFDNVLDAFDAVDLVNIGSRADADAQMRPAMPISGVRAFLLQNLVRQGDRWRWRHNIAALAAAQAQITGFPAHGDAARFDGPTSFIYGERSDYVRPSHHTEIERLFPNATRCEVAAAGHWVYADQPAGFMDCLNRFLAGSEQAS